MNKHFTRIGYLRNDGGRRAAGHKRAAGDCVTRALAILTGRSYEDVWQQVTEIIQTVPGVFEDQYPTMKGIKQGILEVGTNADDGMTPFIWGFLHEKIFKLRNIKLDRIKPTLTDCYRLYGDCIIRMRGHVSTLKDGLLQDTDDYRLAHQYSDGVPTGAIGDRKALNCWVLDRPRRRIPAR